MTDLERAQKIIEQYIHTLTWSPAATDDDITLVHGNVRGMASTIAAALAAVREEDALVVEASMRRYENRRYENKIFTPTVRVALTRVADAIRAKGMG